jgi:folate-dependent tRNA-U54 methylase TrmFO/GidA
MNINFGLFPPLIRSPSRASDGSRLRGAAKTLAKKRALSERALADLGEWWRSVQSGLSGTTTLTLGQDEHRFASVS